MKRFWTILLLLSSGTLGFSRAWADPSFAEFYGFYAIQDTLNARVFAESRPYDIGTFIGSKNLSILLGVYVADGIHSRFANGLPNSTNSVLWVLLMHQISKAVAEKACNNAGNPALILDPGLQTILTSVCKWPDPTATQVDLLERLWTSVMGYQAPQEEFLAWGAFYLSQGTGLSGSAAVEELLTGLLLNPYFLIRT